MSSSPVIAQSAPHQLERRWAREDAVDFFRGVGLWMIFIDHLSPNICSQLSLFRFGFSDFAEVFVFLSGFINVAPWERVLATGQPWVVARKAAQRIRRLYLAQIISLLATLTLVAAAAAQRLRIPDPGLYEWMADPPRFLWHYLTLRDNPRLYTLLVLYVVLAPFFPLVVLGLQKRPRLTLGISFTLWVLSRVQLIFRLESPNWHYHALAWQFLFVLGAATRYFSHRLIPWVRSPAIIGAAASIVSGAAMLKLFSRLTWFHNLLTPRLQSVFVTNAGKQALSPYRLIHFMALAVLAYVLVSGRRRWLQGVVPKWAIACGRESLVVFASGLVLDTVGELIIVGTHAGAVGQVAVSCAGIALMCGIALIRSAER